MRRLALLVSVALAGLFARAAAKAPDPDGTRLGAAEVKANEAINDSVSLADDPVDWKKLQLAGTPGPATFTIHWDEPAADVALDVYNEDGVSVGASPQRAGQEPGRTLVIRIDPAGVYYMKVTALAGSSVYTVRCKWGGAAAAGPATPPGPPPPGTPPRTAPPESDPMHPRCKVVQSFRSDDGALALYLDVGFAKNVQVGASGELLAGASGDALVDGSLFNVTKVVDATHSVAKSTTLPKVGRNVRCVVHLAP
jgi:hypothetical protein